MSALNQEQLEAHILNGSEHTYQTLRIDFSADERAAMQIDRTLQKLRRNKKIKMRRDGRTIYWKAIPPKPAAPTVG
jgi:nicotinamide mononucleotide adenylyltransferase